MTNTTAKLSDLWHGTMLAALTACMAVGIAGVARSATPDAAPSVTVAYGDLDLASEQGASTLRARLESAAHKVCDQGRESRELWAYAAARACEAQAVANAVREVDSAKLAASFAAHHEQI
jgi:UrcA family protein